MAGGAHNWSCAECLNRVDSRYEHSRTKWEQRFFHGVTPQRSGRPIKAAANWACATHRPSGFIVVIRRAGSMRNSDDCGKGRRMPGTRMSCRKTGDNTCCGKRRSVLAVCKHGQAGYIANMVAWSLAA